MSNIAPKIKEISCHKTLNSRAEWTIETTVVLDDGSVGVSKVPGGASTGENEAICLPADRAVDVVGDTLNNLLVGRNPFDQEGIDRTMIEADGTPSKKILGGNSVLSVSLAVSRAVAAFKKMELYEYLGEMHSGSGFSSKSLKFPTPLFNILNGGKHANNDLSFQEFMVIPARDIPFDKALELGVKIYHFLEARLQKEGYDVAVGDEGGFAPNNFTAEKALSFIRSVVSEACTVGKDVFFGVDVAAGSFYETEEKSNRLIKQPEQLVLGGEDSVSTQSFESGRYVIAEEGKSYTSGELGDVYIDLLKKFELIYLEDPFYERDFVGWRNLYEKISGRLMLVADDLVVTNPAFLEKAIKDKLANAVIIKPNQVGTLTETLKFVKMAQNAGLSTIVSHRSGDTEDTFIADLSLAVGAAFIKAGAPARGERVAKYNRLLDVFDVVSHG